MVHVRARAPTPDELAVHGGRLAINPTLLAQVQERGLAPGVVALPDQLLVRLDAPRVGDDAQPAWDRIDVILGAAGVLTIEPAGSDLVDRALARGATTGGGLLASIAGEVAARFKDVWEALEREIEALLAGGAAPLTTPKLAEMRAAVDGLARAMAIAEDGLATLGRGPRHPRIGEDEAAALLAARDRLRVVAGDTAAMRARLESSATHTAAQEVGLGIESPEIIDAAIAIGERRLDRLTLAHAITAFIGGLAVSFGAAAMSWTAGPWLHELDFERAHLLGSLLFPIGFVVLIFGRGELFTENFFVPVTGVMGGRGTIGKLLLLWGSTLVFNLIGGLVFATLVSRPGILPEGARDFIAQLAVEKVTAPFLTSLLRGVFAGWIMTLLTWLLLATRGPGPRLVVIWIMGFLISAGHFNHVVISAAEIYTAIGVGAPIGVGTWATRNFLPALVGNLVGGIVFVTLLGYLQAHSLRQSEERLTNAAREA